jgi:hypothetical protein
VTAAMHLNLAPGSAYFFISVSVSIKPHKHPTALCYCSTARWLNLHALPFYDNGVIASFTALTCCCVSAEACN